MDDLTAFITARLDEDKAALADDDNDQHGEVRFADMDQRTHRYMWRFADHDRVRREVAAKRAIVAEHRDTWNDYADGDGIERTSHECRTCEPSGSPDDWPCPTIKAVAAVWSDHPDYKAEWSPETRTC